MTTSVPYIDRIEDRTNKETEEVFSVAIFKQLMLIESANGNTYLSEVEVSKPVANGSLDTLRQAAMMKMQFPTHQIVREACAPYQWENPSSGKVETYSHTYQLRKVGGSSAVAVPTFVAPQNHQFEMDAKV